jgi:Xaa-Pro aminopeptidase
MEICGESGHWSEIDVTCAFRKPTELENKLMETELRAYDEILEIAKPGVRLSDMARTFEDVLVEDGWKLDDPRWLYYFHGHGMDDIQWPWYSAMLADNQDAVLKEGMVLCYHPHRDTIPAVACGPSICDDIVITADGAERLSGDWNLRWRVMG